MAESEIDGDYRRDNLEQDEPGSNSFQALQDLEDTFKVIIGSATYLWPCLS